jgi:methyl-accepting chemotaxis protein
MRQTISLPFILLMNVYAALAFGAESIAADAVTEMPGYLSVGIDRVVIDTEGLVIASGSLTNAMDGLAQAIRQLSASNTAFSEEERGILLNAVRSVDEASKALSQLAKQLPQTAQDLSEQLPRVVSEARQPIAELSSGLQSARDSVFAITESLPEATENAKSLVNATLDSALVRLSIYSVILVAVLALAVIGVMWFVYRQYLDPLARKLESLVGAPEHFAAMSRYMKQTSDNLLALQPAPAPESQADDSPALGALPEQEGALNPDLPPGSG